MDLDKLSPRDVWSHFFSICSIPHPSHREERLANWIHERAHNRGYKAFIGGGGNVILSKPASPGRENSPGVIIQAHLDMVAQAVSGSTHNFLQDPIRPRIDPRDPEWLIATDTTLGADNGIGVATAMALIEDETLIHGPIECLFTTNEEDGMGGARQVKAGALTGTFLINLDGENENELTIGCAGTLRTAGRLVFPSIVPPQGLRWLECRVTGLLGGHSGVDIDRGRGNASLLLCRVLSTASELYIAALESGDASNAIPRDARALIGISPDIFPETMKSFDSEASRIRENLSEIDPGFSFTFTNADAALSTLEPIAVKNLLSLILRLPNGLIEMDPDVAGLIRSSLNLGVLKLGAKGNTGEEDGIVLETRFLVRSSVESEKERIGSEVESMLRAAGAVITRPSTAPAWTPNLTSQLLALAKKTYRELYGKFPEIRATHGGLECGLFRQNFPVWDMISIGPTIRFPHSPDEALKISSVSHFYQYARTLIEKIAATGVP